MRVRDLALAALAAAVITGFGACSGGSDSDAEASGDTLTRRQRDSIIGESPLPGAQGVRGALRVADSAAARARLLDSIAGSEP